MRLLSAAIMLCLLLPPLAQAGEGRPGELRCREDIWGDMVCKGSSGESWKGREDIWGDQVWRGKGRDSDSVEIRCREDVWGFCRFR